MIAIAKTKHVRGSARKMRQVIDLIRGKNALEALAILRFANKKPSYVVTKTLRSAIANAKNKGINEQDLVVSKIIADEGPRWKRFRAATFGRAAEILKRTSHLTIELDLGAQKHPVAKVETKAPKKERRSLIGAGRRTAAKAAGKGK